MEIKIMKFFWLAMISLGVALFSGCATTPPKPDALTIQGTWRGQEVRNGQATTSWLTLVGHEFEFHGATSQEWYRGTYTLDETTQPKQFIAVITQSPLAQYVGKTARAIYEFVPGPDGQATLVITGNEPGDPQIPSSFSDRRARQIVFTRD
jgi:uncharacterized protein (TIGR03067 family)